uniref:Uncharacterized protein n=1 Tax=Siphoviridae sp. ctdHi7 TaxID=2825577 RepID=A0A8S5U1X0_9CAUD|nr:MAG TPA: hypothetical protein [Siphoviridae sp. ctdHi7]
MIYDYNHYNDPAKGNKHIYAYGGRGESIEFCGFIHADNRTQAQTVLNAHNRAWNDYENILLDYDERTCRAELQRRESAQKAKDAKSGTEYH